MLSIERATVACASVGSTNSLRSLSHSCGTAYRHNSSRISIVHDLIHACIMVYNFHFRPHNFYLSGHCGIPLLQPSDLEKLGIAHVGERVMLISLAKAQESV